MIRSIAILLALGSLLVSACRAELDWTYHPKVPGIDAPVPAYVTSKLETGEIRYIPPQKWTVSGTRFLPPGKIEADEYAEAISNQTRAPWTPERGQALYAEMASQITAKGATTVTLLSAGVTPILMAGQAAYEICFSYSFYGQAYTESVVLMDLGRTQLRFHFGCLQGDFAALHPTFVRSLRSVQPL
jgi:hypothetical protein